MAERLTGENERKGWTMRISPSLADYMRDYTLTDKAVLWGLRTLLSFAKGGNQMARKEKNKRITLAESKFEYKPKNGRNGKNAEMGNGASRWGSL